MKQPIKYIFLGILVAILSVLLSCKSMKKSKTKTETQTETRVETDSTRHVKEATSKTLNEKSLTISTTDSEIIVDIVPNGPFVFHPEEGFSGEAKSIKVTETKKETKKVEDQVFHKDTTNTETAETFSNTEETEASAEASAGNVERKPSLLPWIGGSILLAALIGVVIFLIRRKKIFL